MPVDQLVRYAKPIVGPGETHTLYSATYPFAPGGDVVSCTPEGTSSQFRVSVAGNVAGELAEREYNVNYQGEDLTDCQITIERAEG